MKLLVSVESLEEARVAVEAKCAVLEAFLAVAIPRDPKHAFEWAHGLMAATSATSVKMNFGPSKATHIKIFWGKPEVNTLVEIGGEED